MFHEPLFSVVIPAYNAARVIGATLETVLAQTTDDYEIIIVNDGSTDETEAVITAFPCDKIRLISVANGGVSRARNRGMSEARGKYIALLDADDYWLPRHLEAASLFLEAHPDICWYANRYTIVRELSDNLNTGLPVEEDDCFICSYYTEGCCFVHSSSVVFRRSRVEAENFFPTGIGMGEDIIAWTAFAARHESIGINRSPLTLYIEAAGAAMNNARDISEEYRISAHTMVMLDAMAELVRRYDNPRLRAFFRHHALSMWTSSTERMSRRIYLVPFLRYWQLQGIIPNFFLLLAHAFLCVFRICVHVPLRWFCLRSYRKIERPAQTSPQRSGRA